MNLATFLAHLPTYPFTICEHLMPALTGMLQVQMGCFEEWGDNIGCAQCGIGLGFSIIDEKKGNIHIDYVDDKHTTYYLKEEPKPNCPPIYSERPTKAQLLMRTGGNA